MISTKPAIIGPPWSSARDWKSANRSIAFHLRRYRFQFDKVANISKKIGDCLGSIFPLLDELCANTCVRCPEPCCLSAKIWFDFQDLLYLHFSRQPIPLAQPLQNMRSTCRCLSHGGCTLPRSIRPWICTWYLCPVQKTNLKNRNPFHLEFLNYHIEQIKTYRKEIESEYIRIVF